MHSTAMTAPALPSLPAAAERTFLEALPPWARPPAGACGYSPGTPRSPADLRVTVARALASVGFRTLAPGDDQAGGAVLHVRGDGVAVTWQPHPVLLVEPAHEIVVHVLVQTMQIAVHEVLLDLGFVVVLEGPADVPVVRGLLPPEQRMDGQHQTRLLPTPAVADERRAA